MIKMFKQIRKRLSLPSPDFWKKVGNTCLVIGTILGAIGGGLLGYFPTVGGIVIAIGATIAAVGKILASLTVENTKDIK